MTRTELATWLSTNEAALVNAQEAAAAVDGKYRQVLLGNLRPAHRERSLAFTIPVDATIDEYVGPRGKGWLLNFLANESGSLFVFVRNYGQEIERTHTWRAA